MFSLGFVKRTSTAWCNKKQLAWMDDITGVSGIANTFTETDASNKSKTSKYEFQFRLNYKNIQFVPSYIEFGADSQFAIEFIQANGRDVMSLVPTIKNGKQVILNKEISASSQYDAYTANVIIVPKNTYLQITYRISSSIQGSQALSDANPTSLSVLIHIYK